MCRFRRSRPSQPEEGFTLIEVMVAAAISLIVLVAAADLLANLMTRTTKIQEAEQARAVIYQVSERARALGCGMVYASDTDLTTRGTNCANGLKLPQVGTATVTQPTSILGETTVYWSDGTRTYQVRMQSGWDYSTNVQVAPGEPLPLPDVFVRRLTVSNLGASSPLLNPIEFREAVPDRVGQGLTVACGVGTSGSATMNGKVTYSIPVSQGSEAGKILFPYVGASSTCT